MLKILVLNHLIIHHLYQIILKNQARTFLQMTRVSQHFWLVGSSCHPCQTVTIFTGSFLPPVVAILGVKVLAQGRWPWRSVLVTGAMS